MGLWLKKKIGNFVKDTVKLKLAENKEKEIELQSFNLKKFNSIKHLSSSFYIPRKCTSSYKGYNINVPQPQKKYNLVGRDDENTTNTRIA